jgi:hypothetical protein
LPEILTHLGTAEKYKTRERKWSNSASPYPTCVFLIFKGCSVLSVNEGPENVAEEILLLI